MSPPAALRQLQLDGVTLAYDTPAGTVTVLDDVSVVLPLHGVTVLVGPSGAGKSSLLRLCNRLEVPTSGRVVLDGVDLADGDPLVLRRRVGMVFQRPVVFAGSVADNLAVADPAVAGEPDRAAAVLARCGLDASYLGRTADELSGGEAQRMCIARTLLTGCEVVLMDEVTSSLDALSRSVIEGLARDLADSGIAVVWVTHDLDGARRVGDRIWTVDGGSVTTAPNGGPPPVAR